MNWIQQFKQRVEQENPQPERQDESQDPAALHTVDDFLEACCEVSDGAETLADTLFANYQAFCESRQVGTVNATAFSVRVMNCYRGVQRDEVISDGKRIAIYRGLAPKPQTEPPPAETVSERLPVVRHRTPTEPVPIKDLSRDELIACIREMESELDEPEGVIDEYWGMVDLQVWLKGLEQLRDKGRRHPVPMSAEELDYYRVK